jgi:DNA primase
MTVEEMEETLERLGIEVLSTRGDEVQGHCPAHLERTGKEDRNPSWYINADTGAHNCFSCGFKGSLYSLISYVEGIDYEKAKDWVGSVEGMVARFNRLTNKSKIEEVYEPIKVTESMLNAFITPPDYAIQARGLTSTAVNNYGIKWDNKANNWIIPIREPLTDRLLGWQEKGFDHRYFNNRPTGIKKGDTLFGFSELVTNWAIVVESPLDVVRLASLNYPGVATFGTAVTLTQFNIIRGLDKIVFAMDNDDAGRISSRDLLNRCKSAGVEAWFFNYDKLDVKDIGAMSLEEVKFGVENAKHIIHGEKALR